MSPEELSLTIQTASFVIIIIVSAIIRRYKPAIIIAIIYAEAANIICQVKIVEAGPGAFVGFFCLPLFGVVLASATVTVAKLVEKIIIKRKHDEIQI